MKFEITAEQKVFFEKNHYIEFEGLVKASQLEVLKKCKESGRDLSRKNPDVKKLVESAFFAKIAKELFLQKGLRFGFDELFELPLVKKTGDNFSTLFERSTISPLVACAMICISKADDAPNDVPMPAPFAQKEGSIVFFLPTLLWDLEKLNNCSSQKHLLIAYANTRALYIYQENDPYTHTLKALGYVFGDRLKEQHHPTLGR